MAVVISEDMDCKIGLLCPPNYGIVHDNRMKKNSTKLCTEINIKFETKSSIRLFLDINYL